MASAERGAPLHTDPLPPPFTALQAFTYPDRTCYPVASCNTKDFYNLVNVYLDAVLSPRAKRDRPAEHTRLYFARLDSTILDSIRLDSTRLDSIRLDSIRLD